jgi:hypothetical protein
MLRAISSVSPQSILAAYIVVGAAVIFVPILYYWQECKIDEQYSDSTTFTCNFGDEAVPGISRWLSNPIMFILYMPLIAGTGLAISRKYRQYMSAQDVRVVVVTLTGLTFATSIMIIWGSYFVHFNNEYYAGKQCYAGEEWMQYCLLGRAKISLSSLFAPIEMGLGVVCIALAILYRIEY